MPFVISDRTKARLAELMKENDGSRLGYGGGGGVRQVIHVKVTGGPFSEEDRRYPCKPLAYDAANQAWEEYGQDVVCWVYEANGKDLENDERYLAVRYGERAGDVYYVADNAYPLIKCGLKYEEDEEDEDKLKLNLDLEGVAGDGLEVPEDSDSDSDSGECPKLRVKEGCGIIVDEDGVSVDVEGLAGDGLTTQAGDFDNDYCDKLKVNTGCGLRITEDDPPKLALDLEAIAYEALRGNNDACALSIAYGCHLDLGPDPLEPGAEALFVDLDGMAGDGLTVVEDCSDSDSSSGSSSSSGPCCPKLAVDPGCGLVIDDEGKVAIDTEEVSGTGPSFSAITSITADGCGIKYNVTPFTFKVNECGVFLGIEPGEPVEYALSLDACCDCDSDSDSDSSSSDDSCAGWYCCEETGQVVYVANCEELATAQAQCGGPCAAFASDPPGIIYAVSDCNQLPTLALTRSGDTWSAYVSEGLNPCAGGSASMTLTFDPDACSFSASSWGGGPVSGDVVVTSWNPFAATVTTDPTNPEPDECCTPGPVTWTFYTFEE